MSARNAGLREAVERLASRLLNFDILNEQVPAHVDVPDDYEAGVNEAGYHLRALLAEHPTTPAEGCDDRLITCPECRSTFEAEDGTICEPAEEVAEVAVGLDFIKRLVGAWDCCGTCAGGVLATHDAALTAKAKAEGRVEALREAADAIEAGVLPSHPNSGYRDGFARAAQIVRGLMWEPR